MAAQRLTFKPGDQLSARTILTRRFVQTVERRTLIQNLRWRPNVKKSMLF